LVPKLNNFLNIFNISNISNFKSFIFSEKFKIFSLSKQVYLLEIGTKHHRLIKENNSIIFNTNDIDILYFEKECENVSELYSANISKIIFLKERENPDNVSVIPVIIQNRLKYLIIILNITLNKDEFIFLSKCIDLVIQNIFNKNIVQKRAVYIDRIISKLSPAIMVRDRNYNIIISNKKFSDDKYKCYDVAFGFNLPCEFCPINSSEITKNIDNRFYKIQQSFISPNFLCIVDDITSIIRLKEELNRSEKLSFLGKISSEITHEIKNPLNSIKLKITLLEKLLNSKDEKIMKNINAIYKEIERLSELLNDFLQFGKNIVVNKVKFDLSQLVDEVLFDLNEVFKKENISLDLIKYNKKYFFNGDILKIKQVFYNLIKNSIEALKDNNNLRKIIIELKREKHAIKIYFKDNGKGIAEPEKLFTPFFTTKNFGTGLGLVIVKKNLELHNGVINYKKEREFTVFEVILPV